MTEQTPTPAVQPVDLTVTRERWLRQAIETFRPRFVEIGFPLPERIRISVGFGSIGARQENAVVLGVTYKSTCSADGVNEVFISPEDADTASMLATVLHELIHVALDNEDGHKGRFAEAATRLGFEGKMTETTASITLAADLISVAAELGEYPGAKLNLPSRVRAEIPVGPDGRPIRIHSGAGPQTSRMIKVSCQDGECEARGYTARVARKWLDLSAPICPGSTPSNVHKLSE